MKPTLTDQQKDAFQKQFQIIAANSDAKVAISEWDGTFGWIDNVDMPILPGFKPGKLHGKLADDYNTLMNRITQRSIK